MEPVAIKIGRIALQHVCLGVKSFTEEDPAGMRPPLALTRRMWITLVIAELVMHAMSSYPENRAAFKSHSGEDAHDVLDPLWGVITTVGQQAVITHADTYIDGKNVQNCHHGQPLPGEEEECRHCPDVKKGNGGQSDPVEAFFDRHGSAHSRDMPGGHIMNARCSRFDRRSCFLR